MVSQKHWLYKMVNGDGTVILKMGSLDYDINDAAPPSNNTDPRYYTPTCSSASLSIASSHAHAAKVYRQIPEMEAFAQILESDAILCWNRFLDFYENDNLETDCDDQTVKAGDADWDEQTQIFVRKWLFLKDKVFRVLGRRIGSQL